MAARDGDRRRRPYRALSPGRHRRQAADRGARGPARTDADRMGRWTPRRALGAHERADALPAGRRALSLARVGRRLLGAALAVPEPRGAMAADADRIRFARPAVGRVGRARWGGVELEGRGRAGVGGRERPVHQRRGGGDPRLRRALPRISRALSVAWLGRASSGTPTRLLQLRPTRGPPFVFDRRAPR